MTGISCGYEECIWCDNGECMIHDEGDPIIPGDNCDYEEEGCE